MNDFVLDELFPLQEALDREIQKDHAVSYEGTHRERILALLVELGEFANETRCFKFWSEKGPSPKERILDEYADGMHFFLSLGIPLGVAKMRHKWRPDEKELTLQILKTYDCVVALLEHYDVKHYGVAFGCFLNILPLLGYTGEDAIAAYKSKLAVNYERQKERY
ncbi:MAG: dUTP diphosphatase [Bacilli bacterium]|jgi:dimeric dUTPase (all-alpha-NTP-PPase superfamily)|nr:dUTP diphosphatase [Bacilli bacterium]